jgi:hypothetical protein
MLPKRFARGRFYEARIFFSVPSLTVSTGSNYHNLLGLSRFLPTYKLWGLGRVNTVKL